MNSENQESQFDKLEYRFGGVIRSFGVEGFKKINSARVAVVGVGGVGSWAAEALARTGVGHLTLMDFDDVCQSNINRQILALSSTVGKMKVDVLANRFVDINPKIVVDRWTERLDESTLNSLFERRHFDCVVDCIDQAKNKSLLIAECKERKIAIVTCGGSGGKKLPQKIQIADLNRSQGDPLLSRVRKILRKDYRFPSDRKIKMKVQCVFSDEQIQLPDACATDSHLSANKPLDCANGLGTLTMVTGTFGFMLAHLAVNEILKN